MESPFNTDTYEAPAIDQSVVDEATAEQEVLPAGRNHLRVSNANLMISVSQKSGLDYLTVVINAAGSDTFKYKSIFQRFFLSKDAKTQRMFDVKTAKFLLALGLSAAEIAGTKWKRVDQDGDKIFGAFINADGEVLNLAGREFYAYTKIVTDKNPTTGEDYAPKAEISSFVVSKN